MSYYEILEIQSTASQSEIRKAYLLKARQWHPDKNQGDPNAEAMFKKISQAYKVLSDEEKRKIYDQYGEEGVMASESTATFSFKDLFKSLFGAGKFDDIFDDIFYTDLTMQYVDENAKNTDQNIEQMNESINEQHTKECFRFSKILLEKIQPFVEHRRDIFMRNLRSDIEEKIDAPGGAELLTLIGYVYTNEAEKMSERYFGLKRVYASIKESAIRFKSSIKAFGGAYSFKVASEELESNPDDEKAQQAFQDKGLDVIWKIGRLEIERIVRGTCKLVLRDPDISKNIVKLRIDAVKVMGKLYKEKGNEYIQKMKKNKDKKHVPEIFINNS